MDQIFTGFILQLMSKLFMNALAVDHMANGLYLTVSLMIEKSSR
jgi:hypothetical protein